MTMTEVERASVDAVRSFNRFYTRRIGVLTDSWQDSAFSLGEARVLFELAQREQPTASELVGVLGIDRGYLSRILAGFEQKGLIRKKQSRTDGRQRLLALTSQGREAFAVLDGKSHEEVVRMLSELTPERRTRLLRSIRAVEEVLDPREQASRTVVLRPFGLGDLGLVTWRHGVVYGREYGFDERFEALVADILLKFVRKNDPKRERGWIAEVDGEPAGSIFCMRGSKAVAKLRLLLVEPHARGLGVGTKLVDECVRFARLAGYTKLTLWTNDVLKAARRVYERAGFALVHEERHEDFGPKLVGQTWDLAL